MNRILLAIIVCALLTVAPAAKPAGKSCFFYAGAGKARIEVSKGMPLAGYVDRYSAPSTGVHHPVFARALILSCGKKRAAMVNADLLLSTRELAGKLKERVSDLGLDLLVVTATHTHYSLGGYVDNPLAELAVMGGYDPHAEHIVLSSMEKALRQASRSMQPALAGAAAGESPNVSKNRRHQGGPTDPRMRVIGVWDRDGTLLAMIVNHAIHPTIMPSKTMKVSGGCTGVAESRLEKKHPRAVAMYMNAGLGDQGPGVPEMESDWRKVDYIGAALADRADEILAEIEPASEVRMTLYEHIFPMPEARLNPEYSCWYGLNPLIKLLGRDLIRKEGRISGLGLNGTLLLFSPGELGYEVQAELQSLFPQRLVFVVTHSNDYWGYIIMPDDYETGGYESCMNFYGKEFAPLLIQEFERMVNNHDPQ